jgi:Tol biopolymer transport system component
MRRVQSPFAHFRAAAASAALVLAFVLAPASAARAEGVSRIAYSSFQSSSSPRIWLVDPDGSNPSRVQSWSRDGDGAAISPDGTQIVYETPRNGWANLYLIGVDGSNEHRLLGTNFYGQSASWKPDGSQLVFTHSSNNGGSGGTGTTWRVDAGGTNLVQLSPSSADDWLPCWSPDGTLIAFSSTIDGQFEIWIMNPDGTGRQQLSSGPGAKSGPRWSPDGSKIAYTLFPDITIGLSSIHVMGSDGAGDTALTDTLSLTSRPCWSPDGLEIAFQSNREGNFRIYRMSANGTDVRPVTMGVTAPGDWCGDWRMVSNPAKVDGPQGNAAPVLRVTSPVLGWATIWFAQVRECETRLEIFDSAGRLQRALLHRKVVAGDHSVVWDAKDDAGRVCPAGVYHCRLTSGEESRAVKFVSLR